MARRFHLPRIIAGEIALPEKQAHHARDVLRLAVGSAIELFDDAGQSGAGTIVRSDASGVIIHVAAVAPPAKAGLRWIMATAIPKAGRGDWMIEKLAELGAAAIIPLQTERSIVHPQGTAKHERWQRLAGEAARQSGQSIIPRIEPLTPLSELLQRIDGAAAWYLSTNPQAVPAGDAIAAVLASPPKELTLFIGPEGDFSPAEFAAFENRGLTGVHLTPTILRVETAAIVAAAIVATLIAARSPQENS